MIKAIVVGDIHIDLKGPNTRVDDYWISFKRKWDEIDQFIRARGGVDLLVLTGDIFHSWSSKRISFQLWNDFYRRLYFLKKRGHAKHIISVVGNHDHYLGIKGVRECPLGGYYNTGVIDIPDIDGRKCISVMDEDGSTYKIYGMSWSSERVIPEPDATGYNILLAHYALRHGEGDYLGRSDEIKVSEILDKNYHMVWFGHEHARFGKIYKVDSRSVPVFNPGALMRWARNKSDLSRDVGIGYFEFDKGILHGMEWVKLLTARPSEEVFKMKEVRKILEEKEVFSKWETTLSDWEGKDEQPGEKDWRSLLPSDVKAEVVVKVQEYLEKAEREG